MAAALVAAGGAAVADLSRLGVRAVPHTLEGPSPEAIRAFLGRGLPIDPRLRDLVERKKQEILEERRRDAERRRRAALEREGGR
jgi:hypothetical protein